MIKQHIFNYGQYHFEKFHLKIIETNSSVSHALKISQLDENFCIQVYYKHAHGNQLMLSYQFVDIGKSYIDQAVGIGIAKHRKLSNR
jgi:hypothetical protein